MKDINWKNKYTYDCPSLERVLASNSIHAFNGMLLIRFTAQSGTSKLPASRKRAFDSSGSEPAKQEVLVVVDSDQLVDLCNILGAIGTVKMMSKDFSDHPEPKNQAYGAAIVETMELVLSTWKNPSEYFNVASSMKTAYTAATLGSYEEISRYPGMMLLLGPFKTTNDQLLIEFFKEACNGGTRPSSIKSTHFYGILEEIRGTVPEHRAMELLSLLPLLSTTKRYLSDAFERIHTMGDKERMQNQTQISNFLKKYEATIAEWAIRAHPRNIECDADAKKLLEAELRTVKTTTLASGATHILPFELPETLVGRVKYVRAGNRTLWGRFWHLLAKPVSDYPNEEDGTMGPETLAALKNGRYIYNGMTYVEVHKQVSKLGLGYKLFTAIKMENTKHSSNTRMTANPQRVPKWLVSDLEREVRAEGYRVPAMTQCRGESSRSDSWYMTSEQIRSEEPWLITYQDCEAWSEGQNRQRTLQRDLIAIREMSFPEVFRKAWKELWSSPVLTTTRKRVCTSSSWDRSLMQGIRGCGDCVEHAIVLAEFMYLVAKRLGQYFAQIFKGQTNIDDVYSELLARVPWDSASVSKIWRILKEHYSSHGYLLDDSKSGLSCHKVTYLGLSSVLGPKHWLNVALCILRITHNWGPCGETERLLTLLLQQFPPHCAGLQYVHGFELAAPLSWGFNPDASWTQDDPASWSYGCSTEDFFWFGWIWVAQFGSGAFARQLQHNGNLSFFSLCHSICPEFAWRSVQSYVEILHLPHQVLFEFEDDQVFCLWSYAKRVFTQTKDPTRR